MFLAQNTQTSLFGEVRPGAGDATEWQDWGDPAKRRNRSSEPKWPNPADRRALKSGRSCPHLGHSTGDQGSTRRLQQHITVTPSPRSFRTCSQRPRRTPFVCHRDT